MRRLRHETVTSQEKLEKREIDMPCVCMCVFQLSQLSDSLQPHRLQPIRPLRPWDSPGKSTGVGCHFLLHRQYLLDHWANLILIVIFCFMYIPFIFMQIQTIISENTIHQLQGENMKMIEKFILTKGEILKNSLNLCLLVLQLYCCFHLTRSPCCFGYLRILFSLLIIVTVFSFTSSPVSHTWQDN